MHILKLGEGGNNEFIESVNLLEASLYEGTEFKRLALIDKGVKKHTR